MAWALLLIEWLKKHILVSYCASLLVVVVGLKLDNLLTSGRLCLWGSVEEWPTDPLLCSGIQTGFQEVHLLGRLAAL